MNVNKAQKELIDLNLISNTDIKTIDDYKRIYTESVDNRDQFWANICKRFDWKTSTNDQKTNFDYNFDPKCGPIGTEFMSGSQTNVCFNLIDRNIELGFGDRIAYHWVGHEFELRKSLTYNELKTKVCQFANVLKRFGLKKGDAVVNYMPDVLPTVISMLACARLGIVFANTFPGYSAQCLADRMLDLNCKLLVASDVCFRAFNFFNDLKKFSDEAIHICEQKNHKIIARILVKYLDDQNYGENKSEFVFDLKPRFDYWWDDLMASAEPDCPPVWLDSEDPLFVIFSSGSTGKQKAIVHSNGGFMVFTATVFRYAFNYKDGDILYCSGCLGWITGQFSHVFGSLANAATVVLSEGSQTHPTPGRWWRIIDNYKVNIFYCNPTDIRNLRSYGDNYVMEYAMSDLKVIGVVGEIIDESTWKWLFQMVGRNRCPIVDTYFQSETGCPIIFPIPSVMPLKPGSVALPFFGIEPVIVDENGEELTGKCSGTLLIKTAWPSIARTLYGDHERYQKTYFDKYPKYYFTGDGAVRDNDGYIRITGRVDDMINKYSLLISPADIESALLQCESVSEVAAVPIPDQITGSHICCFVVLKPNQTFNEQLVSELKQKANLSIGVVGIPKFIHSVRALPKNRSGKVMRRLLAKILLKSDDLGDISTLNDKTIIDEIKLLF